MVRIIMDATTRGLDEAVRNLKEAPALITQGIEAQIRNWYRIEYRPAVLRVIETGQPASRIPPNVGRYALDKERDYGITHGLGRLTGRLYAGVNDAPTRTTVTRGKEVRFAIDYREPFYIAYVHDGTSRAPRERPFVEVARDETLEKLLVRIEKMFEGLQFTDPLPELISSVIATKT